jgi:predicted permease
MAVLINTFGQTGVQLYGILIGLIIPLINVLCVSILIWYDGSDTNQGNRFAITLKHLMANPLIIACIAGIAYSRLVGSFPTPIDNTLKLMSQVTLPLALFSIGGSLTFANLRSNFSLALAAAGFSG